MYLTAIFGLVLRPFDESVILLAVSAMRNGIPSKIAHTIANHAKEGDGTLRSPEAVIINEVDILNFEAYKSPPTSRPQYFFSQALMRPTVAGGR